MKITSATFVKGIKGTDTVLEDGTPQIAFIGRSNVGKSSVINSLVGQGDPARTSSTPGRTQEINLFLINKVLYFVDLPGYGFTSVSKALRERLQQLINWYLFDSPYQQKKVILIIDAYIGLQDNDLEMLRSLEEHGKKIIVVANKTDKIKKTKSKEQLQDIRDTVGDHPVIAYSAEKRSGVAELLNEILA